LRQVKWILALSATIIGLSVAFVIYQDYYFLPGVKIASVPVEGYKRSEAALVVEKWVDKLYANPVRFEHETYSYETTLKELCLPLNATSIVNEVIRKEKQRGWLEKIKNLDGSKSVVYPVSINYKPQAMADLNQLWGPLFNSEPVNAFIKVDQEKGLVIEPGKSGKIVDIDKTFARLPHEWVEINALTSPIVLAEKQPRIKAEDFNDIKELASFTTWYNVNDVNRTKNLSLAADLINGIMINPDEIFSFNETVGPRTYDSGYRDALIISSGNFEPGLGGGICQVSSTLYNAVLLAGLEIVERHNHALAVAYVPLGQDATVAHGLQDFKFINNTAYPLHIRSLAKDGKLTINVYGNINYKPKVNVYNVIDKVTDFEVVEKVDPQLKNGEQIIDHEGINGYTVRSFRSFLNEKGEIIKTEQLSYDVYKPLNKLVYVGLSEEEPMQEPETVKNESAEDQPVQDNATGEAHENKTDKNTTDENKTDAVNSEEGQDKKV